MAKADAARTWAPTSAPEVANGPVAVAERLPVAVPKGGEKVLFTGSRPPPPMPAVDVMGGGGALVVVELPSVAVMGVARLVSDVASVTAGHTPVPGPAGLAAPQMVRVTVRTVCAASGQFTTAMPQVVMVRTLVVCAAGALGVLVVAPPAAPSTSAVRVVSTGKPRFM